MFDERSLHGIEVASAAKTLYGDHVMTVGLEYELNTGADRAVFDRSVARTAQKYRTRPTIAF